MAITSFKVIQGHRLWYQLKAYVRLLLVINSNLPHILHRFQVMSNKKIGLLAIPGVHLQLTPVN